MNRARRRFVEPFNAFVRVLLFVVFFCVCFALLLLLRWSLSSITHITMHLVGIIYSTPLSNLINFKWSSMSFCIFSMSATVTNLVFMQLHYINVFIGVLSVLQTVSQFHFHSSVWILHDLTRHFLSKTCDIFFFSKFYYFIRFLLCFHNWTEQ